MKINTPNNIIMKILVFTLLLLIILNPYTIIGPLGSYAVLFLIIYSVIKKSPSEFFIRFMPLFLILFIISTWGALISYFNNIGQLVHIYSTFSLILITISAESLWKLCNTYKISFYDILYIIILVIITNSIVIILEINFPALRGFIETYLIDAGNRDWSEGFRYRGLASSGGAVLSVLNTIGISILLYLYSSKRISILFTVISFLIMLIALVNIGRTGLALTPIVLIFFLFSIVYKAIKDPFLIVKTSIPFLLISILVIYNYDIFINFLDEKFGSGFKDYAFGFLLEGEKGIESEGTVDTLLEFNSVFPTTFPEMFTGVGFYGIGPFEPWTDSGFARMILSVGWLFGILYYIVAYNIYFKRLKNHQSLMLPIVLVLMLGEFKEPMLFSGYPSRLLVILTVFNYFDYKKNRLNKFE